MFAVNEDLSIYVTRGDTLFFPVTAKNNGEAYLFQPGDIVRLKVFGKKACDNLVIYKEFPVTEATEQVPIFLAAEDTKFGELISNPTDYWYEIKLIADGNVHTIVGYDENGPKVFRMYPEGADVGGK